MDNAADSYRPFFNRKVSPVVRQLIVERHRWLAQAATSELRRFMPQPVSLPPVARPALSAEISPALFALSDRR